MTAQTAAGVLLMLVGFALFAIGVRAKHPWARSGGLIVVLTGFFVLFTMFLWQADGSSAPLSVAQLLGAAAVFRLMASFESAPPDP
ncbi:MAG TPA: hypothetical protein VE981_06785 [Planctomycetota bacterium]|nr:hypothetical protein [Planctomycetota bacterium]